jgi:hypothetical protein
MRLGFFTILLLLLCIFISCAQKEKNISTSRHQLIVYDTLKVSIPGRLVKVLDFNVNTRQLILGSSVLLDTLYLIDSTGDLISKFSILGEDESSIGKSIFNLGFYSDTSLIAQGARGFSIYDLSGSYISSIPKRQELKPFGVGTNIRMYRQNDSLLVGAFFSSLDPQDVRILHTEQAKSRFKPLNTFNLNSQLSQQIGGFDTSSKILTDNYQYDDLETVFTCHQGVVYYINNPELKIYQMAQNNLIQHKNLIINDFQINVRKYFGETTDDDPMPAAIVNSKFRDINGFDDVIFITYSSGIPVEKFKNIESSSDIPQLFLDYMRYKTLLVDKSSLEIIDKLDLPKEAIGIGAILDKNTIVLNTNPNFFKDDDYVYFLMGKLITN